MKIRRATFKDLEGVWEIEKQSRKHHARISNPKFKLLNKSKTERKERINFINDLKKELKDRKIIFLVAEIGEDIAGWVWSKLGIWRWSDKPPKMLWVEDIGVLERYRNQGVAQKLFNEIEKNAKRKGIKYCRLTVWSKNKPAYDFYRKNKFEDFAIEMVKKLK